MTFILGISPILGGLSLIIANHSCLMDIFFLPAALPEPTISLISSRLIYKKILERQRMMETYLYGMPIEAHGGPLYSNMCLNMAIEMLKKGYSTSIFPEGAYVEDNSVIYRGRTGVIRILYACKKIGIPVSLVPVAIDFEKRNLNLDSFSEEQNYQVTIKILKTIPYEEEYKKYQESNTLQEKNKFLHRVVDKSLIEIAKSLNKSYKQNYIELYPKGNVIYASGEVIPTELAQENNYVKNYAQELEMRSLKLQKELKLNQK